MKPRARLRERRLTFKPRIVVATGVLRGFWVERLNPHVTPHPSIRGVSECFFTADFQAAVDKAHQWAGPKPQEDQ